MSNISYVWSKLCLFMISYLLLYHVEEATANWKAVVVSLLVKR